MTACDSTTSMDNLKRRFNSPTKAGVPACSPLPLGGTGTAGGTGAVAPGTDVGPPEPSAAPDAGVRAGEPAAAAGLGPVWGLNALQDAEAHVLEHLRGVDTFCGTGAAAVGRLATLLAGTRYGNVSEQCRLRLEDVQRATRAEVAQVATEVKVTLGKVSPRTDEQGAAEEDIKLVATAFTRLMQLHCQFLLTASEVLAPLSKSVADGLLSMSPASAFSDGATKPDSAAGQLNQSNSSSQENPSQLSPANHSGSGNQGNVNEQDSGSMSPIAESNKSNHMVHAVGSPSGLRKISSFFSKLTRSGSGSPSGEGSGAQSAFYVSIPKEDLSSALAGRSQDDMENREGAGSGQSRGDVGVAPLEPEADNDNPTCNALLLTTANMNNLKLPQGPVDISQVLPGLPPNGRLATQEELDSVIDLLSGGQRSPMQVIPENVPSHHVTANKPPPLLPQPAPIGPQHYVGGGGLGVMPHLHHHPMFAGLPPHDGPPPPLPPSGLGGESAALYARSLQNQSLHQPPPPHGHHHGQQQQQHRRSDGMLGETFSRDQKTNTWPYRPHGRAAAGDPGLTLGGVSHHTLPGGSSGGFEGPADLDYARYLAAVKAMKAGAGPAVGSGAGLVAPLAVPGPWGGGDAGLHRSWPMHLFTHDGSENVARNWSTVGDSSSCSDESSTGDTPWSMGLDLVGAVSDKRRHSSGEESFPSVMPCGHVVEIRPRSVENLLDSKTTNTWPPKQPWARLGRGESEGLPDPGSGPGPPHPSAHAPLTMQWSDPLTNRPLSAWDGGRYCTPPSYPPLTRD